MNLITEKLSVPPPDKMSPTKKDDTFGDDALIETILNGSTPVSVTLYVYLTSTGSHESYLQASSLHGLPESPGNVHVIDALRLHSPDEEGAWLGEIDGGLLLVMDGAALSAIEGATDGSKVVMIGDGAARAIGAEVLGQVDSGVALIGVFTSISIQASSLLSFNQFCNSIGMVPSVPPNVEFPVFFHILPWKQGSIHPFPSLMALQ